MHDPILSAPIATPRPTRSIPARLVPVFRFTRDPFSDIALCGLGMVCFWNLNGIARIALDAYRLFSVMILIFGFMLLARNRFSYARVLGRSGAAYIVFLVAFIGIASISLPKPEAIISYCNGLFITVVGAVGAWMVVRSLGLRRFLFLTTILLCVGAWTVFLSPMLKDVYEELEKTSRTFAAGRWMGFFANPNETGFAACLAAVGCFSCLTLPNLRYRWMLWAALGISLIGVLFTFSRSGILVFLALYGFYSFFTLGVGRRSVMTVLGGAAVALLAYWFFIGGYKHFDWSYFQLRRIQGIERMLTGAEVTEEDLGGRSEAIQGALHYWRKSPIYGHGLGTFQEMPEEYFGGLGCHNMHLTILGESGVLGAGFYVAFLVVWLVAGLECRIPSIRAFVLGTQICYLALGLVSHNALEARNFNLMIGISIGLITLDRFLPPNASLLSNPSRRPQPWNGLPRPRVAR